MAIIKILQGHNSPETAYVVEDYPYGFTLRCKIRYWLEKATKGSKKYETRLMVQTTNPKLPGEVWNKPKSSNYNQFMIMYLDENNHVQQDSVSVNTRCEKLMEWQKTVIPQLTPENQQRFEALLRVSKRLNPNMWATYENKLNSPE